MSIANCFHHLPCHSAICHLIPNCFCHLSCHSSHRPLGPILIPSRWQAQHNTFDQPPHLILPSITHSAIHHKSSVPISPFCQDSKLNIPLLISLPSHSTIHHVIPPSITDQFPPYSYNKPKFLQCSEYLMPTESKNVLVFVRKQNSQAEVAFGL